MPKEGHGCQNEPAVNCLVPDLKWLTQIGGKVIGHAGNLADLLDVWKGEGKKVQGYEVLRSKVQRFKVDFGF